MISIPVTATDSQIQLALERLGLFAGVDRVYIFQISDDRTMITNSHEWCADGIEPQIAILQNLPLSDFAWIEERLEHLETLHIPNVADLPPDAAAEREILEIQSIQSLVIMPMASQGRWIGFIGFDSVRTTTTWDTESIGLLRFVATIFVNALNRRRAEQALHDREQQYRRVVEQVSEVIFQLDEQGRWQFLNPAWRAMVGSDETEALGRLFLETLHADDHSVAQRILDQLWSGERELGSAELRLLTADGAYRWVELRARTLAVEEGRSASVTGTLTDLTPRKLSEQILHESELRFRQIAENIRDVIYVCTPALDQFFYVSPAFGEIWGVGDAALYERPALFLETIIPEDRSSVAAALRRHPISGGVSSIDFRIARCDGDVRWIGMRVFSMREDQRYPPRLTGIAEDITERKRHEQALRQSNRELAKVARMKDEFLASMSHELRTPLNAILGIAEVLQEQIYGPVTKRQITALQQIDESGRHLLALINDILDLSKIEAGQLTLDLTATDVRAVCLASLRLVEPAARHKGMTARVSIDDDVGTHLCDSRRLTQILVNLLSNAVKFTPVGGEFGLEVKPTAHGLTFTVWDTGIGISPEDQKALFQPFVQLDSSLARAHGGTGLGLALVRRMTELHGGEVRLESEQGGGSRFIITLPDGYTRKAARA
jgi:PAS domain S-box-containing protein